MNASWSPHPLEAVLDAFDSEAEGERLLSFAERAYPLMRSITGEGVRQTLELLRPLAPELAVHEVPSGTEVLDWTVPPEWTVRHAVLRGPDGAVVCDVADHTLHLLNYSAPFTGRLDLEALRPHLYSDPARPDAIPYRTSYYRETWGFCLEHRRLEALEAGEYEVAIDTTLAPGHLTYGEVALPATREADGAQTRTGSGEPAERLVLLSTHVCHPSLANDNLSGLGVAARLAGLLAASPRRRFGYRIVFVPGTIGAITWLARNRAAASRVAHGAVLANLGDGGVVHWKRSRQGDAAVDRAVARVLADSGADHVLEDFVPFGYDERQYGSPGFDLPVGLFSRTPWGRYPEYHTSDDDLSLLEPASLADSLRRLLELLIVLETDGRYRNLEPYGEPQLGRRGLYGSIGGGDEGRDRQLALLWVLNQSDGETSLLDIAERSGLSYRRVLDAARALGAAGLLAPEAD